MPHVCWCWGWSPRPSPYWGTTYAVRDKVQRASPWDSGMGTHGGGRRLRFAHGGVHLLARSHVVGLLGSPGKQGRYASAFSSGQWVSLIPREYCSRSEAGAGGQLAGRDAGTLGPTLGVERSQRWPGPTSEDRLLPAGGLRTQPWATGSPRVQEHPQSF